MSIFQFGHAGVDLFFVISGFIICYVHFNDIGKPERIGKYLARRFQRVFPLYWLALALTIALSILGTHSFPTVLRLITSALLFPFSGEPLLGIAWTLQFEVTFYFVFCICICNRRVGLSVAALWLAVVLASAVIGPLPYVPALLLSPYNLQFLFGVTGAVWLHRSPDSVPDWFLPVGIGGFLIAALAEDSNLMNGYHDIARLAYGVPCGLMVLGAAMFSFKWREARWPLLSSLGAASYSIYLFQFLWIGMIWKIWQTLPLPFGLPSWTAFPFLAIPAIWGGCIVSRTCEYPMLQWIRRWTGSARPRDTIDVAKSRT